MKSSTNEVSRTQNSRSVPGEGPNWILIAGGALLSTLSIRLGYKLKQFQDTKQLNNDRNELKEKGSATETSKSASCQFHSNAFCCGGDQNGCFSSHSDCLGNAATTFHWHFDGYPSDKVLKKERRKKYSNGMLDVKEQCTESRFAEAEMVLPLVRIPAPPAFSKENSAIWSSSSPQRLELPQKPFNRSNSSESPSVSEAGSDLFTNREVIQKLRQQLKRRDEMIMEMQDQIAELQNALNSQMAHSTHLQSLLDSANRDFFDSEREIQRLRKAIADYCVAQDSSSTEKQQQHTVWPTEDRIGHENGYSTETVNNHQELLSEKSREAERVEMLKREVNELKEVIEGKEYLLQSYKEQKVELSTKVKELQHRLDSQLLNIL